MRRIAEPSSATRRAARRTIAAIVVALAAAAPAAAQIGRGETGLWMVKPSGNAGLVCGPSFACTFTPTSLARGESVDLWVRGVFGQPFAVALGVQQPPLCLPLPGVHNALLFVPTLVPFAGVLNQPDTVRACPGGYEKLSFSVPQALPSGAVVLFQALAWSYLTPNQVPTFTIALAATVQ